MFFFIYIYKQTNPVPVLILTKLTVEVRRTHPRTCGKNARERACVRVRLLESGYARTHAYECPSRHAESLCPTPEVGLK